MTKLTIKQEKYAQNLFKGLSQRDAFKEAYNCENMTDKSIDEKACVLANSVKVRSRIQELTNELSDQSILTVEWVLNNLKKVTERCMQAEPVMIRDRGEMVETGEYTFQANGANRALELIGKYLAMFTENVKIAGDVGVTIINDIPKDTG